MGIKLIEVRDRGTFIPALAMRVTSTGDVAGDWLLRRGGFSLDGVSIILMRLTDCAAQCRRQDADRAARAGGDRRDQAQPRGRPGRLGRMVQRDHAANCQSWVCAGDVTLNRAQYEIATDWRVAYKKRID